MSTRTRRVLPRSASWCRRARTGPVLAASATRIGIGCSSGATSLEDGLRLGRRGELVKRADELVGADDARAGADHLAVVDHNERRDRADLEGARDGRLLVD